MASNSNLKFMSFNCFGVKNKLPIIRDLCNQTDILFLQETWLLPHDLGILNSVHPSFVSYSTSAVNVDDGILTGRPFGGLSILWNKCSSMRIKVVNFDDVRMSGIILELNGSPYLCINVYLPYYCAENIDEYYMYMGKLSSIVEECDASGIIVLGDFNADVGKLFYRELERVYARTTRYPSWTQSSYLIIRSLTSITAH